MQLSMPWARRLRFTNPLSFAIVLVGVAACSHQEPAPAAPPSAPGAAAELPGATPAASTDPQGQARASVFVVHTVSDVEGFKKYFEGGAGERTKAGVLGYLLTKLDDGRYVVHFVAESVEKVEQALKSDGMQSHLNRDGAPDMSLVWVTRDEILKVPLEPPPGETYSLFLKLHVNDFAALKQGVEQREALFRGQDVIGRGLHQSTARDDVAILHVVGTSKTKLEELPKRPEFVELLTKAGNRDVAKPLVGLDVARSR